MDSLNNNTAVANEPKWLRIANLLFRYAAAATALWHLIKAFVGVGTPYVFRATHLSIFLFLTFSLFLIESLKARQKVRSAIYAIFTTLAIAMLVYFQLAGERLTMRIPIIGDVYPIDIFFAIFTALAILVAIKRKIGWPMVIICVVLVLYTRYGYLVPGYLNHKGYSWSRLLDVMFMGIEGIFGSTINVTSRYIIPFVLFGCLLSKIGASDFINNFANCLVGTSRGGPAKVSAVSSALFGMISGAPTANVVTTGAFTIPMMKKSGYSDVFSGAVEAVASAGGAITPPIMGSTVFLVSEILGLQYSEIASRCILCAVLYYVALLWMIDLEAQRKGLLGTPREQLPRFREAVKGAYVFVIPFGVLVYMMIAGYTTTMAGLAGCLAILAINIFNRRMRLNDLLDACTDAIKNSIVVVMCCAAAGIIISTFQYSGLSSKFTTMILSVSGGNLYLMLALVMVACIVLGMGIPITGSYILLASLAAPALITAGVQPLCAHMFIFYYAVVSVLTPPVATAAYAAAGLSGASPAKTGWMALRLGITAYIVPYLFVFQPELLCYGSVGDIVLCAVTALIGVVFLGCFIQGWFRHKTLLWERILFGAGGLLLMIPGWQTDLLGVAILAIPVTTQLVRERNQKKAAVNHLSE